MEKSLETKKAGAELAFCGLVRIQRGEIVLKPSLPSV